MSKYIDLTGRSFGRLTVIERALSCNHGKSRFLCLCKCGNKKIINSGSLIRGLSLSCGCLKNEIAKNVNTTHGMYKTPEYKAWKAIKDRCNGKTRKDRESYYNKGITYCKEWESFENFLNDMGRKPTPKHSIDRINNHGNYEPSNCRWATKSEQARNRKSNKKITFDGETKCLTEWAESAGISYSTLHARLKRGWSFKEAITAKSNVEAGHGHA